jgi:hypothetical protein
VTVGHAKYRAEIAQSGVFAHPVVVRVDLDVLKEGCAGLLMGSKAFRVEDRDLPERQ